MAMTLDLPGSGCRLRHPPGRSLLGWLAEERDPRDALTLRENLAGAAPQQKTLVWVWWEPDAFCCFFRCEDDHIWASRVQNAGPLWEEEVVEVFLDPFGDALVYFEIEINPVNAVTELVIRQTRTGWRKDFRWRAAGMQTLSCVQADGWGALLRLPFAGLGDCHPQICPHWRVNFARIDRPRERPRELSAWSPTRQPTFHDPRCFGHLHFQSEAQIENGRTSSL